MIDGLRGYIGTACQQFPYHRRPVKVEHVAAANGQTEQFADERKHGQVQLRAVLWVGHVLVLRFETTQKKTTHMRVRINQTQTNRYRSTKDR